jgi:hypothetical protein
MKAKRIQLSRKKGWRMPPNTVSIARPGYFGNPFRVGWDGDQATCVRSFKRALLANAFKRLPYKRGHRFGWMTHLRGKNLACWCKPGDPCHADVLMEIVNR